jgi:hypothetical protein
MLTVWLMAPEAAGGLSNIPLGSRAAQVIGPRFVRRFATSGFPAPVGPNDAALVAHLIHGGLHRRPTLRTTSNRGMIMAIVLVLVIPLAILLAWAVVQDLKRRRSRASGADVASRVRGVKAASEAKLPPGG